MSYTNILIGVLYKKFFIANAALSNYFYP